MGRNHTSVLTSDGIVWAWGLNTSGQIGINCTQNTSYIMKTTLNVTEMSKGDLYSLVRKIDNKDYGAGDINKKTTYSEITVEKPEIRTKDEVLNDILLIGNDIYSQNTAVILENGDVYTTGDNTYGQIGDGSKENSQYYVKMGSAYLDYEDKTIELADSGYQFDVSKLKYVQNAMNVYNKENRISLGEVKLSLYNESLATIDEKGFITAVPKASGSTKLKIEDVTNGYEVTVNVIVGRLSDTESAIYIYTLEDLEKFRDNVNSGENYEGKTVYVMADIDMSTKYAEGKASWQPIGTNTITFAGTFDGNYHTISNLYINDNTLQNVGLFSTLSQQGIIQNLIMQNVNISVVTSSTVGSINIGSVVRKHFWNYTKCRS